MSSAAALSGPSLTAAHQQFEAALPAMTETIRYHFRLWPRRRRADAIDTARAACWLAWHGLIARGKDPLAVGVTAIAFNASRYVKNERQFGCGTSGRGGRDIFHHKAQADRGFKIISLDRDLVPDRGAASDAWREWLAGDNSVSPADEAAFRVDFQEWLDGLPGRDRRVAELLAYGEATGEVARRVGVSSGRVSQLRRELAENWKTFQGEAGSVQHRAAAIV
jgi:hypothetical protein